MSWASRRRNMYLGSITFVILAVVVWVGVSVFYEAPTCFDSKQNGEEEGIDCGGSCSSVCTFQAVDPIVLWSRFFEVSSGVYSAAVLIENPNTNAQAGATSYTLKLRDAENILVYEQNGSIPLPSQRIIPFFTTGITTGERVPIRSTFVFDETPSWKRITKEYPRITITNTELSRTDTTPRLTATVQNEGTISISDIIFVAVLSDVDGNAQAVSQTVVEKIEPDGSIPIIFTWPKPFSISIASIDILPRFPLLGAF